MLITSNNAITRPQGLSESEARGNYALMHALRTVHMHTQIHICEHTQRHTRGADTAVEGCHFKVTECM